MSVKQSATTRLLRIYVIAGFASSLGVLVAVMLFLSALFSHSHVLGATALVALAISLQSIASIQGLSAYFLFKTGTWTTLAGRPASRSKQPTRFAIWVALHSLFAAIYSAAAAVMIWIAMFSGH